MPDRGRRADRMLVLWPLLTAVLDYLALVGVIVGAYLVRFNPPFSEWIAPRWEVPSFEYYVQSAFVGAAFCVLYLALTGVYRVRFQASATHEAASAMARYLLGWALLMAGLFFYRDFLYSRIVALMALGGGMLALALVRSVLGVVRRSVFSANPLRRAVVVGPLADAVSQRLDDAPTAGLSTIARLPEPEDDVLRTVIRNHELDTVVLAYPFGSFAEARALVERLGGQRLLFLLAPDPDGISGGRLATLTIAGLPVLRLREDPLAGWNGIVKRSFDVIVSLILLVLLAPLLGLLALAVRLSSPGSVIYEQTRVGLDGQPFTILKFRSMRPDAEKGTGPVWATPGDARTTRVGAFLRRWSLDELPQLINVLRGDMSLVGPRPERPAFVEEFRQQVPRYADRHRVRAGMTGWAQVHGLRGQAPIEQRTRYDVYYVENWSLALDLAILAKTVVAVIAGRDAY